MRICEYCGSDVEGAKRNCIYCGAPLKSKRRIVESEPEEEEGKDYWWLGIVILFGLLFLGIFIYFTFHHAETPANTSVPTEYPAEVAESDNWVQPTNPDLTHTLEYELINNPAIESVECGNGNWYQPMVEGKFWNYDANGSENVIWGKMCIKMLSDVEIRDTYRLRSESGDSNSFFYTGGGFGTLLDCNTYGSQMPFQTCDQNTNMVWVYDKPDYKTAIAIDRLPAGQQFDWFGCVQIHSYNSKVGGGGLLYWVYVSVPGHLSGWIDAIAVDGGCGTKPTW